MSGISRDRSYLTLRKNNNKKEAKIINSCQRSAEQPHPSLESDKQFHHREFTSSSIKHPIRKCHVPVVQ